MSEYRRILALETSSTAASVALRVDGGEIFVRRLSPAQRGSAELFPAIQSLLNDAQIGLRQLDLLCWSCGPGSFTGLRVAATVARMTQAVAGCAVAGVCSLDVIAQNAVSADDGVRFAGVMVNAKAGHAYSAAYARGGADGAAGACWRRAREPALRAVGEFVAELARPCVLLGDAVRRNADACRGDGLLWASEEAARPDAVRALELGRLLAGQGWLQSPEQIVPMYLRAPECEEVYEQRRREALRRREATDAK